MLINELLHTIATHNYYFVLFIIAFVVLTIAVAFVGVFIGKESAYVHTFITFVGVLVFSSVSGSMVNLLFTNKTTLIVHPHILIVISILLPLLVLQCVSIIFLSITRKFFSAKMFRYRANGISIYQDRVIGAGLALVSYIPFLFLSANLVLSFRLSENSGHFINSITSVLTMGKVDSLGAVLNASSVYSDSAKDDSRWKLFMETLLPNNVLVDESYREKFIENIDDYKKIFDSQNFLNYLIENIDDIEKEFNVTSISHGTYDISPLAGLAADGFEILLKEGEKNERNVKKIEELTKSLEKLFTIYLPPDSSDATVQLGVENLINLYYE